MAELTKEQFMKLPAAERERLSGEEQAPEPTLTKGQFMKLPPEQREAVIEGKPAVPSVAQGLMGAQITPEQAQAMPWYKQLAYPIPARTQETTPVDVPVNAMAALPIAGAIGAKVPGVAPAADAIGRMLKGGALKTATEMIGAGGLGAAIERYLHKKIGGH